MSRGGKVEAILGKAGGLEKKYEWAGAAVLYEQALRSVGKEDFLKAGEIQEKIGFCYHRAAMQAEGVEEFRDRMRRAITEYEKAVELYEKLVDPERSAKILRCKAVVAYLGFWLAPNATEKRKVLDECWRLGKEALTAFWKAGNALEYGMTYNDLSLSVLFRVHLEWNGKAREKMFREMLEHGEKAITALSELGDSYELARTCLTTAAYLWFFIDFVPDPNKWEKWHQKAVSYLQRAEELSEEIGDAFLTGMSNLWLGTISGGDKALKRLGKALQHGKKTRDNFLIGGALDYLAFFTYWKAKTIEEPDKRRELAQTAVKYAEDATHQYSLISLISPRFGVIGAGVAHAEHYWHLALWETDLEKRRDFLESSLRAGIEGLKFAEDSGYPGVVGGVLHVLSKTLEPLAQMEVKREKKRKLLERALEYRERTIKIFEQTAPFNYWDLGVMQNYLANIKADLADMKANIEDKRKALEEAIISKENCLKLCTEAGPIIEKIGRTELWVGLGAYQDSYGALLGQLYDLTNDKKHLRRSIQVFQQATESARKLDMVSRVAEFHWKIAKAYNSLGKHPQAAENFKSASERYRTAAEKIPELKDFYEDHASYMQAWSEIEKARHRHTERQYGQAKEHYEKAAHLHESTERWNHLSPNYSAWAKLEEGEDLSRREQTEEAKGLFQQAADLFIEAKKSIKTRLERIESKDEEKLLVNLAKVSDTRRDYCLGRVALEEAKILDRQGDHAASSRRYGSAAENFQKTTDAMEDETDRQELRPIVALCRAWQIMTSAEAEASPDLYSEASQLFEEAKEHSPDEKTKVLALGHSRFCKALEAGTRFEDTGDTAMYSAAKKHIEAAEKYYFKAGFKNASEYARAAHMLFDAYMYLSKAEMETEPRKKAQYYQMVERLLQASTGAFMKAKHPEKSEEVRRLLEGIREKRRLAISLTEVLHAPTTTSTTTSFSAPTPTYEQAVGLERFEHADIQATLLLRVKEANVGDDVGFRIELVNAGKAPALLIKVDEITPESFQIGEVPAICTIEDSYLNLKGRRLNPLKTIDIKLTIKPQSKGTFSIKPRVLYIDEAGKYKSHEPEPITITVKELGIKGWIKGES